MEEQNQRLAEAAARGEIEIPGTGVKVRIRHLSDYQPNSVNPVSHSPRNFSTVLQSIQKLGALRSGFASGGTILGGNLTMDAMVEAGIEYVVEVQTNGGVWTMVDRPDLTDEMKRLAAYYDQQSAFLSTWNAEQVAADQQAGFLPDDLFYENEVEAITNEAQVRSYDDPRSTPRLTPPATPTLPLSSLVPNDWAVNAMTDQEQARLKTSISRIGILEPLLVRPVADGRHQVVHGMQRFRVAKELGLDRVPVTIRGMTDDEAKLATLASQMQGRNIASRMRDLLAGLSAGNADIGRVAGLSKEAVDAYTSAVGYGYKEGAPGELTRDYREYGAAELDPIEGKFLLMIPLAKAAYDLVCDGLKKAGGSMAEALEKVVREWMTST